MAKEDFGITDEDLKQRWIEWGCEEDIVDYAIAKMRKWADDLQADEEILNPFSSFYWLTYLDRVSFEEAVNDFAKELGKPEPFMYQYMVDDNDQNSFSVDDDFYICDKHKEALNRVWHNIIKQMEED